MEETFRMQANCWLRHRPRPPIPVRLRVKISLNPLILEKPLIKVLKHRGPKTVWIQCFQKVKPRVRYPMLSIWVTNTIIASRSIDNTETTDICSKRPCFWAAHPDRPHGWCVYPTHDRYPDFKATPRIFKQEEISRAPNRLVLCKNKIPLRANSKVKNTN